MSLGVGLAAESARFLGAEPDDADGAQGTASFHDALCRSRDDRDAGAVIDRARAEIPAVEMPPDKQYRPLRIAARHLGDDVARATALGLLADERQVHDDPPAA